MKRRMPSFKATRPRLRRTTVIAIVLFIIFIFHLSDDYTHITPLYWQTATLKGARLWDTEPIEPWWEWNYTTDAHNLLLTHRHCEQAFHGLFKTTDQSVRCHRARYNRVNLSDLDKASGMKGVVRAMIYDQQLYVISTGATMSSRSLMVLSQIHRALITSPEQVANIEFTFTADEQPADHTHSPAMSKTWTLARKSTDHKTWLMPAFLSDSTEPFIDARRIAEQVDQTLPWDQKHSKLLWRGSIRDISHHITFLNTVSDQPWADIQTTSSPSLSEICTSKYLAHTRFPSPLTLPYLQLCTSVLLLPTPQTLTTYTSHLLQPSGPSQNHLPVASDWSDISAKIRHLREWDTLGERIARNSVEQFRERFLTEAAEVCAWRRLMRGWREVQGFEVGFWDGEGGERGVLWEGVLMGRVGGGEG